ncbi:15779_t:CDS:2, partial [Cetraspora pellucida]
MPILYQISHRLVSNRELVLEQINQALRDELSNEVSINRSNEKYINELERKYTRCEKEIQSLNKELERLENALEEEKADLRSEILSLKRSFYQAKKEVRDKASYIDNIEKQLQESEERIQNLRYRFKVISSRRSSPSLYNSEVEDIDMVNLNLFIQIDRGLNRIENHLRGAGTPLNNPINIINGIRGSLNAVRLNYQSAYQDIDGVIAQRDNRDAQIVQLQQEVNLYRQQNITLQNQQNIVFQRQIEEIEKSRNFWKLNAILIKAQKDCLLFGTTVQGGDPVGRFYSNLRRLARLAGIDEQQIRLQFFRELSPANQMKVRHLGIEKSVNELLPRLEEIERYTAEQLSGAYLHSNSDSVSSSKGRGKDNYSDNT